jgi:hypothetical protein
MKALLLCSLFCSSLAAQSLTFLIDNSNGALPSSQLPTLPANYTFAATPIGGVTSIVIRVVNSSTTAVKLGSVVVDTAPPVIQNPNFTVTGWTAGVTVAPQAWQLFTLNFTPSTSVPAPGYLQILENTTLLSVSTLQGTVTPRVFGLTCTGAAVQCNGSSIQPDSTTPLDFGNISTTTSAVMKFTLTNDSAAALNAQSMVSLITELYNTTPFALDKSALPTSLAPNSSANFTITFSPGSAQPDYQATLSVGTNAYLIQGSGVSSTVGDISSLTITYTDQTGVRLTAQPATPITFTTPILSFTVTNPQTTIGAVTVPTLTVTGAGFNLSGASTMPASIAPGQSMTFQITFSASAAGAYNGTLSIGTRTFSLAASAPPGLGSSGSALPGISLICGAAPCSTQTFGSQQQIHLALQLSSAAPYQSIVTFGATFAPSVTGITGDPTIGFISPISTPQFQVTFASGSQQGTYQGQSQFTFQTGTTAGTITFTLTYPVTQQTLTWSITIAPSPIQITSTVAQRQGTNLVVTLTGYDNTYSAGNASFTFYDNNGKLLQPALVVPSATPFQQYFFGSNDYGGAFSLQVTFAVNGDPTQVGSVGVSLSNAVPGATTVNQAFQ